MSDASEEEIVVDISEWVEKSRSDPTAYLERQATEVFLNAIAMAEPYCEKVFLKGGILMGVVYKSIRQTSDIDFTTILDPSPEIAHRLRKSLTDSLGRAAAALGYPDLVCRVQTVKHRPRAEIFAAADGPALEITIGYARRGTGEARRLERNNASRVLYADISFREPVGGIQVVRLGEQGVRIRAYSLLDLLSEKLRALLQQVDRDRYRRQDIYDIDFLLRAFTLDAEEQRRFLVLFQKKCRSRNIKPTSESLSDPEVIRRARAEWDSLKLEIGQVPKFETCFETVELFYRGLPWDTTE